MQNATRNDGSLFKRDIYVREINRQKSIIASDRRTQKQRRPSTQTNRHPIKMAGLDVEQAQLSVPYGFDIPVTIEDSESIAILENASAIIGERGRCQNVILLFDANYVTQS